MSNVLPKKDQVPAVNALSFLTVPLQVYMKCSNAPEENTATSFTCSEIPTMNSGKLIGTSTCPQTGLALPLRTQRGERGWATTMNTTAGPGGGEAPV